MTERFDVIDTPLAGLKVVERKPVGDERGFLERLFCAAELAPVWGKRRVEQANRSFTAGKATLRGMHFQRPPDAETKLISCLRGEVFDVVVDVRAGSPTFLRWHGERLSADNRRSLLVPEGFAHGFQTMTEDCEMLYFHSAAYSPDAEDGLHPLDPVLAIEWPLPAGTLSPRDRSHAPLSGAFRGVVL